MFLKRKGLSLNNYVNLFSPILFSFILIYSFIPRDKMRTAQIVFFFNQTINWLFGLSVVEKGLVKNTLRLFNKASKANFGLVFLVFPVISAIYIVNYPVKRPLWTKVIYNFLFITIPSIFEVLLESYTKLFTYKRWHWIYSLFFRAVFYFSSLAFWKWFFEKDSSNYE